MKNAARVMANLAKNTEIGPPTYWQLKTFVYGAIILSYAYLEASFNEVIHLHALAEGSQLDEAERKAIYSIVSERLEPKGESHTLAKFNMLLRLLGKPAFEPGRAPYQSANLVRMLRNMLIHPIPGRVATFVDDPDHDYSSQQEIVKKLRSALGLQRTATFPTDIITSKCALWAVASCESYLHRFVQASGINVGFITDPHWPRSA